jgi:hypothetical protein
VSYQQVINKLSTGFTKLSTSYQQVFCKVMHKLSTGFAKLCTSYQQVLQSYAQVINRIGGQRQVKIRNFSPVKEVSHRAEIRRLGGTER